MELYLIRHLPTKWNLEGKLQGKRDIPIDFDQIDKYNEKIEANKELLSGLKPFDYVLASSLIRTNQTAALYGFEPTMDSLLDELDFGPYEGNAKASLIKDKGDVWFNNPESIILGESVKTLQNRILLFLNKYKSCEKVLVFGHGSWIRALISMHKSGSVNLMNQFTLANNDLIHLEISSLHISRS